MGMMGMICTQKHDMLRPGSTKVNAARLHLQAPLRIGYLHTALTSHFSAVSALGAVADFSFDFAAFSTSSGNGLRAHTRRLQSQIVLATFN